MDFSTPHSYECLTFLTPESSEDNSWETFIQPFNGEIWLGVILSLFAIGTLFYVFSYLHSLCVHQTGEKRGIFFSLFRKCKPRHHPTLEEEHNYRDVQFRRKLQNFQAKPRKEDLFDNFSNCILLTYSMLMYVCLPRVPDNWPLRVLTGWYWIYCILVTTTYRASFTAILANPAPRITIDTVKGLEYSSLKLSVGTSEQKRLFDNAFDESLKELGTRTTVIDNIDGVVRVLFHHLSFRPHLTLSPSAYTD